MDLLEKDRARTDRRTASVRKRLKASGTRYRLSVTRSNRQIYAQIIDDSRGITACEAHSISVLDRGGNCDAAVIVGRTVAERAISLGIFDVVFDRGSRRFHGRVAALAEAARQAGLRF